MYFTVPVECSAGPGGQTYPNNSCATSATGYTVLYVTKKQEALDLRREVDLEQGTSPRGAFCIQVTKVCLQYDTATDMVILGTRVRGMGRVKLLNCII